MDDKRRGTDCNDGVVVGGNFLRETKDDQGHVRQIDHIDGPMFTSTHLQDDDTATFTMAGKPPQNDEDEYPVCVTLAEAITKTTGEQWEADPKRPDCDREPWIDRYLNGPRGRVPVQVTKAGTERDFWQVGSTGRATGTASPANAAAQVWAAIERKISKQDRDSILAVSVRLSGVHGFKPMVDEFRRTYGDQLGQRVGYAQVWLVGYSLDTTCRVDS